MRHGLLRIVYQFFYTIVIVNDKMWKFESKFDHRFSMLRQEEGEVGIQTETLALRRVGTASNGLSDFFGANFQNAMKNLQCEWN